jgi:two-component system, NarL family, response regulator NreC
MTERLTVILVENSFIIQSGIEQLLQEFPELELIEVFDGSEKKLDQKIIAKKPDFLILNPEMVKDDLVSFVNRLIEFGICMIGLTDIDTATNIVSRFKYTLKLDVGKYELLEELKKITGNHTSGKIKKESQFELSEREITILKEVVIGLTNQEIADKLYLSIHTITTHRKNITRKLGIKTVSGLTVYALMNRIVDLNDMKQR